METKEKEMRRLSNRRYREKNKERLNEDSRMRYHKLYKESSKKYNKERKKLPEVRIQLREASKRYRTRHPERHNQTNRNWAHNNPEKIRASNKKFREENREKCNAYHLKSIKRYPERRIARALAEKNILINNQLCESCKKELAIERHHPDYAKPLKVQLLCMNCHNKITYKKEPKLG